MLLLLLHVLLTAVAIAVMTTAIRSWTQHASTTSASPPNHNNSRVGLHPPLTPLTALAAAAAHVCVFLSILRGWNLHRLLIQGGSMLESRACATSHAASSKLTCHE
jgi:hypothetical protein